MTYKRELIAQAVKGTDEYHDFMRKITVTSLKNQAGFIPSVTTEPTPYCNPYHWQSKHIHMSIGVMWIFFATESGHFTTGEAKRVWRYGQAQLYVEYLIKFWQKYVDMTLPETIIKFAKFAVWRAGEYTTIDKNFFSPMYDADMIRMCDIDTNGVDYWYVDNHKLVPEYQWRFLMKVEKLIVWVGEGGKFDKEERRCYGLDKWTPNTKD